MTEEEKQLTKAKEIIKNLVDSLIAIDGEQIKELEVVKEAEQFIKLQKKLKAENKKCKEIIKRTVVENFCCNDCREVGLFDKCQKKEKSCETIVSEWFDEVMG